MTRHRERFHQAARDNYLDLLREATSSECDSTDDNGMTPVMWAAFYGHLEALRVLMGRGANPDRPDHMGSTALHFAALNGHMNCVTYLVNFGANIWVLDVDFHSAMDMAGLREHREIVDFLDGVAGRQATLNKRTVAKMRERAALDAHRRAKKLEKLMKKADRRSAREGAAAADTADTPGRVWSSNPNYRHSVVAPQPLGSYSSIPAASSSTAAPSIVLERMNDSARPYSDFVTRSSSASASASATAVSAGGSRLPRTSADVVYARSAGPAHESAASAASVASATEPRSLPGLFERPGFGNVAFLQPQSAASPPQSPRPPQSPTRTLVGAESIGTSASLLRPWRELPWTQPDLNTLAPDYDLEDGDDGGGDPSDLETFLACLGLGEFQHLLARERLDLAAVALCGDGDLRDLGLPLGPRRLLLEALERRREALDTRRSLRDLRL